MENAKTEYNMLPRPGSQSERIGFIASFFRAFPMTSTSSRPRLMPARSILLAALLLCFGQSVAATHLHFGEHAEEICSLCAVSETAHAPDAGQIHIRPSAWRRCNALPAHSATLSFRPYEVGLARAPPVSFS